MILDLALAFLAGLLSFASTCVLPLVPAYVAYMGAAATGAQALGEPIRDPALPQREKENSRALPPPAKENSRADGGAGVAAVAAVSGPVVRRIRAAPPTPVAVRAQADVTATAEYGGIEWTSGALA